MNKVIIFSTAYLPLIGGAEIAVKELTDRMPDYEFDLITARLERKLRAREKIGRVNIYRVGWGSKFDKFLLPALGFGQALFLDKSADYRIIFSLMASQASVAASFFKIFKPEKKLILNLQEGDEEEHLKRYVFNIDFLYNFLIKPWHRLVFKKADLVIAISEYLKKRSMESGVKCPVEIAPNGVETKKYELAVKDQSVRKSLGLKESERILITTSRLVKKNAVGDIIKSLSYLPLDVKLLILGDGPDRLELERLAEEWNLRKRVFFLGFVNQNDLPKYLLAADIFVRPSLSEGLGISFLEAMAAGRPVIATPVGGIPDFLKDQETGLFCEVNNPVDLAEKVKILLENNELRLKIISQAKKLIKEKYDWDIIAEKVSELFRKLCTIS